MPGPCIHTSIRSSSSSIYDTYYAVPKAHTTSADEARAENLGRCWRNVRGDGDGICYGDSDHLGPPCADVRVTVLNVKGETPHQLSMECGPYSTVDLLDEFGTSGEKRGRFDKNVLT